MKNDIIFTIGREYGSGGRAVGELLAKDLGIPFYDRELLIEAAKDSSYSEEILRTLDEQPMRSMLYSIAMGTTTSFSGANMPISVQAFLAQLQTIQRLADENGSCVFVGRCADYALRERDNVISAFICADKKKRIANIMRTDNVGEEKAAVIMKKIDKSRSSYYNYYTERRWGAASNYDLCINSSKVSDEACVELIKKYAGIV